MRKHYFAPGEIERHLRISFIARRIASMLRTIAIDSGAIGFLLVVALCAFAAGLIAGVAA